MKTGSIISLPIAKSSYQMDDEQLTRRTIEQALSDLRQDVVEAHDIKATQLSLALRRFQFLLMGGYSTLTASELLTLGSIIKTAYEGEADTVSCCNIY